MYVKQHISIGVMAVILGIVVAGIMTADESFAFQREQKVSKAAHIDRKEKAVVRKHERQSTGKFYRERKRIIVSPYVARHGTVVKKLPHMHRRVWHKNTNYYFHNGIFYREGLAGFIVVRAPVGAVIFSLPIGYETVWIEGSAFYYYGGIMYRRVPAGYVVVEEPDNIIITEEPVSIVQPSESASGNVSVSVRTLNVRSGPDPEYPLIHQVYEGSILKVYGKADEWLYVQLPNAQFGWVQTAFTSKLEPGSG